MTDQDWTVLLIGGGSCTGKSMLSRDLARRLDLVPIDADLYWVALQRVVPQSVAPELHAFLADKDVWSRPTEQLVSLYLDVSEYVCHALAFAVAHHDSRGIAAAVEGSWILPAFAIDPDKYLGPNDARQLKRPVRSVFLYEPSFSELNARLHERGDEEYRAQPDTVRESQSLMQHAYGQEIARQAEALNLPVLTSRPFDTLLDRALAALDLQ
jgi:2-phosphoglycerate kinase